MDQTSLPKTKIVFLVGTRPNFIKANPVIKTFLKDSSFFCTLIHTGQHFDNNMSNIFFQQLDITPDINLKVKGSTSLSIFSEILLKLEKKLISIKPDWLFVFGDVDSTLAGSIVAKKLNIQLAHIESGLRSFDKKMPEEINRIVTDSLSDIFFVTEKSGKENLIKEGAESKRVFFVGNTMIDTLVSMKNKIKTSNYFEKSFYKKKYIVLTLHRPSNVDDEKLLRKILSRVLVWSEGLEIVWPIHPRIAKKNFSYLDSKINLIEPLGYFEFLNLVLGCNFIITDSGGIQEEATFLNIPCITIRENTERPITIESGSNTLLKRNEFSILSLKDKIKRRKEIPKYWDGNASSRIIKEFKNYIKNESRRIGLD